MIKEETRRAFHLEDTALLKWRLGGKAHTTKGFLLVAGAIFMILLGIRMMAGAALPQDGGQRMRGPMTPEDQLARMTKQLQLTEEQQAKIKPILEDQHKQMMDLRQDSSMSRQDRFTKFRDIRQKSVDKIKPILTADQQQKWQKMQEERRGRRGRSMPN